MTAAPPEAAASRERDAADDGAITAPLGFAASAAACGIKEGRPDLALLVAERLCAAAGVFTTNRAVAAPVVVSRTALAQGRARAVVVNAGCANAATGESGLRDAREMADLVAHHVGCGGEEVVVASTGVIGVALPMPKVRAGIAEAAGALDARGGAAAARAILTTDTHAKQVLVRLEIGGREVRIGAMAKGAGMIAPNMATLLAFVTTDAAIEAPALRQALADAVGQGLNRITVDGDTSTNDMAVILASGAAGHAPIRSAEDEGYAEFAAALTGVSRRLAEMIVRDGEGATRMCEVRVEGAASAADADRIARTVAESPLVKTAIHGGDPNWGRVLAAAGRAGVAFDAGAVDIWIGETWVCAGGAARDYDEEEAHAGMTADPVRLRLRLREGTHAGWIWTCDFSHGYVDINAHYRS